MSNFYTVESRKKIEFYKKIFGLLSIVLILLSSTIFLFIPFFFSSMLFLFLCVFNTVLYHFLVAKYSEKQKTYKTLFEPEIEKHFHDIIISYVKVKKVSTMKQVLIFGMVLSIAILLTKHVWLAISVLLITEIIYRKLRKKRDLFRINFGEYRAGQISESEFNVHMSNSQYLTLVKYVQIHERNFTEPKEKLENVIYT